MALYDLLGHYTGLPLVTLLGGSGKTLETDMTIGINAPEATAKRAIELVEQGFRAIKLKIGTGYDEDIARVRAVREAIGGDIALRLDANQSWDVVTAERMLRALTPFDIEFCEQPVVRGNSAGLLYLRGCSSIPLMADESLYSPQDAFQLAALGAVDYFNIKVPKAGGIARALQINAIAQAAGIRCMVGSMTETRLGLSASAHLVVAQPNIIFADLDTALDHAEDPIMGGITFDGGTITLPDAPGHGANIDEDWLRNQEVSEIVA
jgi:L-alanine-DL-glutamate epimerase-like enolase superfamily enzyme